MAEETKESGKRSRRQLRASSETVRERTEKRQLQDAAPKNPGVLRTFFKGFFWPVRAVARQVGKLGRFKVFRIIGYILVPPYVRNSWRELRLVTWPDRKQTLRLTYAVIVFSLVFGLIVFGVDFVLDKIFKEIIIQ